MKRMAGVLAMVMCTAALVYAGDSAKGQDMTGWICNSKCVTQTANKSTCDKNCTETTGDVVFISNKGTVSKIENQDKVSSMGGKKVKMKASMDKDSGMMHVYEIAPATY